MIILPAIILLNTLLLFPPSPSAAYGTDRVIVYFFWSEGCPHCKHEMIFLE